MAKRHLHRDRDTAHCGIAATSGHSGKNDPLMTYSPDESDCVACAKGAERHAADMERQRLEDEANSAEEARIIAEWEAAVAAEEAAAIEAEHACHREREQYFERRRATRVRLADTLH